MLSVGLLLELFVGECPPTVDTFRLSQMSSLDFLEGGPSNILPEKEKKKKVTNSLVMGYQLLLHYHVNISQKFFFHLLLYLVNNSTYYMISLYNGKLCFSFNPLRFLSVCF
jgi:hypothetical protein